MKKEMHKQPETFVLSVSRRLFLTSQLTVIGCFVVLSVICFKPFLPYYLIVEYCGKFCILEVSSLPFEQAGCNFHEITIFTFLLVVIYACYKHLGRFHLETDLQGENAQYFYKSTHEAVHELCGIKQQLQSAAFIIDVNGCRKSHLTSSILEVLHLN